MFRKIVRIPHLHAAQLVLQEVKVPEHGKVSLGRAVIVQFAVPGLLRLSTRHLLHRARHGRLVLQHVTRLAEYHLQHTTMEFGSKLSKHLSARNYIFYFVHQRPSIFEFFLQG